jgi:hypothetical protein
MTITSVVLGDGTLGGDWGNGSDWATDATGSKDISKGNSNFIVYLDSVWFSVGCLDYIRNLISQNFYGAVLLANAST